MDPLGESPLSPGSALPLLQACLNGNRPAGSHPALPLTPEELAREARASVTAGAGALHLHPHDAAGREALDAEEVAAALNAVRSACPRVPVGISSGFWILLEVAGQLAAASAWMVRPDFVSVNWHEAHAVSLAETLLTLGIGIEAGIWMAQAARAFLAWPGRDRVLRVLVELPDREDMLPAAADLLALLDRAGVAALRLLHGEGRSAWPLLREAGRRGLSSRIGLEDTLTLPDGRPAGGNGDLVRAARAMLASPG